MAAKRKRRRWRRSGVQLRQKVKGGPWWIVINHGGIRKSKCVGTREAADQLADELRAGLALLKATGRQLEAADLNKVIVEREKEPPAEVVTFAQYATRFLERNAPDPHNPEHGLKASTLDDYRSVVTKRLVPRLGTRALGDIKRRDVKELEAAWRAEGLKTVNIRKHLRVLSSILSEAADDELIPANPLLHRGRRRRSKDRLTTRRQDPFTIEDLEHLLATARTHTVRRKQQTVYPYRDAYPIILTLAHTGMRLGELRALRWGDVDWRGGVIHLRQSYTHRALSVTKSGKARPVEMSDRVRGVLRDLYRERFGRVAAIDAEAQATLEAEQATASVDALVFPDARGGYLDERNFRERKWKPLLVAAGLSHRRLHDLRHTFSILHLQSGTDPSWVQEQLGHHALGFTLSAYAFRPKRDQRRYANALDRASAPNAPCNAPGAPANGSPVITEAAKPLAAQGVS